MPSKHIKDDKWERIEKLTVKAVIQTRKSIKERDILDLVLQKGLDSIDEVDFDLIAKKKK